MLTCWGLAMTGESDLRSGTGPKTLRKIDGSVGNSRLRGNAFTKTQKIFTISRQKSFVMNERRL